MMTELDSSVGSEDESSVYHTDDDVSSGSRTQQQLDKTLHLLEQTVQENKHLQEKLLEQMKVHLAVVDECRALQIENAQMQQELLLLTSNSEDVSDSSVDPTNDVDKRIVVAQPTSQVWTTWHWLGAGLVVVTVAGSGLVLYQVYTAALLSSAEAAAHATLSVRAANRARHDAQVSTEAAQRAGIKAQTANQAARVALRTAESVKQWMYQHGHFPRHRNPGNFTSHQDSTTAAETRPFGSYTKTNHGGNIYTEGGMHRPEVHSEGNAKVGDAASPNGPEINGWSTNDVVSTSLKMGAVVLVPILLSMFGC